MRMQFLSQIPAAILYNIGFTAFIYLLYETIKFCTKAKANTLYTLATVFQLANLIHFITSIFWGANSVNFIFTQLVSIESIGVVSFLPYIGMMYCILLVGFAFYNIQQYQLLTKYKTSADFSKSAIWNKIVGDGLDYKLNFKIGYSAFIDTPITFGWLDPIILLPISICNQLSVEQVKVLLLHEIAHIVRYDYIVNLLLTLSHVILHFNPFSYLLIKEINIQREMSCDAWVVAHTKDPLFYAKALFNLAVNGLPKSFSQLSLGAVRHNNELLERVKHVNKMNLRSSKKYAAGMLLSTMMIGFVTISAYFILSSNLPHKVGIPISVLNVSAKQIVSFSKDRQVNINKQIKKRLVIIKGNKVKREQRNEVEYYDNLVALTPSTKDDQPMNAHTQSHSLTYSKLVDNTLLWIQSHESINHQTAYEENK